MFLGENLGNIVIDDEPPVTGESLGAYDGKWCELPRSI
jgi:hypothetical protein